MYASMYYRGIALLWPAGKILVVNLFSRLNFHIVKMILPELQCTFWSNRGMMDVVLTARKIQVVWTTRLVSGLLTSYQGFQHCTHRSYVEDLETLSKIVMFKPALGSPYKKHLYLWMATNKRWLTNSHCTFDEILLVWRRQPMPLQL